MVVSNHWTGLTQTTSFSVGMDFPWYRAEAKLSLLLAPEPGRHVSSSQQRSKVMCILKKLHSW